MSATCTLMGHRGLQSHPLGFRSVQLLSSDLKATAINTTQKVTSFAMMPRDLDFAGGGIPVRRCSASARQVPARHNAQVTAARRCLLHAPSWATGACNHIPLDSAQCNC